MQSVKQPNSGDFISAFFAPNRYSAHKTLIPVNFVCVAPGARQVQLTGDFNNWSLDSHPMVKQPDGAWFLQVQLRHGHHQYRFVVDGKPTLDPKAAGVARDRNGERASLLSVS